MMVADGSGAPARQAGLDGAVAIVSGAGSGIGLAAVTELLAGGAYVIAGDRDVSQIAQHERLRSLTGDALAPDTGDRLVAAAGELRGPPTILVNTVGGGYPTPGGLLNIPIAKWQATFELNVLSMVRLCQAVLPSMLEAGRGSIINIASNEAREPSPEMVDYSASKAALVVTTKALANQYGPAGIRCNVVSPGFTRTPMTEPFIQQVAATMGGDESAAVDHITSTIFPMPLRRVGTAADVAKVIAFLASDAAAQVTGSDYRVDGGTVQAP